MYETEDESGRLQELLDRTFERANPSMDGDVLAIEPTSMWAYAFHTENFPA